MPASVAFTCIFISCLITVGVLKVFMYFCVSFRVEHISNMFGFFFFLFFSEVSTRRSRKTGSVFRAVRASTLYTRLLPHQVPLCFRYS